MRKIILFLFLCLLTLPGISLAQGINPTPCMVGVPVDHSAVPPCGSIVGVPLNNGMAPIYPTSSPVQTGPDSTVILIFSDPPTPAGQTARIEIIDPCGLLYVIPGQRLFVPLQSPRVGATFLVHFIDQHWMQALENPYPGLYLERCGYRVL